MLSSPCLVVVYLVTFVSSRPSRREDQELAEDGNRFESKKLRDANVNAFKSAIYLFKLCK